MRTAGRVIRTMGALAVAAPMGLILATPASAHGAMDNPVSRSYLCYQEGPENPVTDVCQAVVAAGGPQPLYDWMEVNIANAAGNHREIIPDGQLCSAGRDKYRGLDLARSDWPTTTLPSGGSSFTFEYRATAPHAGGYELYVTKDGYDPNQPLRWSDLEDTPFHVEDAPQLVDGYYLMDATLPDKQGRQLIYAIWQRTDSPEAFYACSDVVFGESGDNSAPPPPADDNEDADPSNGDPTDGGDDDTCHAAHRANDDTLAVSATSPDDSSRAGAQPAIAGLAAAAIGTALLLAKSGGAHRRKPAHRKP
jgi:chitin-binding protein